MSTEAGKLPEWSFDNQNRRIWPIKNWVKNPDLVKANLEVSVEVLEELAAEYKVPHYISVDHHDTVGGDKGPSGCLIHFAYLPDGSLVFAYNNT